jgi:hypothetical protein
LYHSKWQADQYQVNKISAKYSYNMDFEDYKLPVDQEQMEKKISAKY